MTSLGYFTSNFDDIVLRTRLARFIILISYSCPFILVPLVHSDPCLIWTEVRVTPASTLFMPRPSPLDCWSSEINAQRYQYTILDSRNITSVTVEPSTMPNPTEKPFHHITVTELHPTFGAEISGVDFSQPVSDEVFSEVLSAISKVWQTWTSNAET